MSLRDLITLLFGIGATGCLTFISLYASRSAGWWRSDTGRNLMAMMGVLFVLMTGVTLARWWTPLPRWFWTALLVILDTVIWWRVIILWRRQHEAPTRRESIMAVSSGSPAVTGARAFVLSIVRELVQKGVAIVALWLLAHGIELPEAVSNWVVLTTVALAVVIWTAVVRFLETRQSGIARKLAKILMLGASGAGKTPRYPAATPEAVTHLRGLTDPPGRPAPRVR